jgi:hypothetical protein
MAMVTVFAVLDGIEWKLLGLTFILKVSHRSYKEPDVCKISFLKNKVPPPVLRI